MTQEDMTARDHDPATCARTPESARPKAEPRALADLLARVAAAAEPDRELFTDVVHEIMPPGGDASRAFSQKREVMRWVILEAWEQAALDLCERALPNTSIAVKRWASGTGDAEIGGAGVSDTSRARAKTPGLALLAALLNALIAEQRVAA